MLKERKLEPEIMDQPGLAPELHRGALKALGRIHRITGTGRRLFEEIRCLEPPASDRPLRLLDMACGGGDVAIDLARRAAEAGLPLEIDGCDMSPVALEFARERAADAGVKAGFFETDLLAEPIPAGYDVLTCSLFLHHLQNDSVTDFLRRAAAATERLLLADDLVRSVLGYAYTYTGCYLLTRSPIVRVDGPISVGAALKPSELEQLARRAGLEVELKRQWPERMLLIWRPANSGEARDDA